VLQSCKQETYEDVGEVKTFFSQLDDSILSKKEFLLVDSVENRKWWKDIFRNQIFDKELSIMDWNFIYGQMKGAKETVWTNKYFDSARIVSSKYIESVSKPNPFDDVPTHYRFSKPFFSKDGNICVVLYDKYCGFLCAETSLRLYKKHKRKWSFIKSFYTVVS
jgi:hypothetical protein